MMNELIIKKVNISNIEVFAEILREAAQWMEDTGKRNWDPSRFTKDNAMHEGNMNEMFLCYIDDEPAGCFKMQGEDNTFWPDKPENEAYYIHKLAVRRKFAGQNIAKAMIDWVKEQAKADDIPFVRLDCIANRDKLCKVYIQQDFRKIDERQVFGDSPSARFEYRVEL